MPAGKSEYPIQRIVFSQRRRHLSQFCQHLKCSVCHAHPGTCSVDTCTGWWLWSSGQCTNHLHSRTWIAHGEALWLPFESLKHCKVIVCDKHCQERFRARSFLRKKGCKASNAVLEHMRWSLQCSWSNLATLSAVALNARGTMPDNKAQGANCSILGCQHFPQSNWE